MDKLSKEDIEFLKGLSKVMKEQDPLATAAPRLWVIRDVEHIPTSEDYGDGFTIYDVDNNRELESEDIDEWILELLDESGYDGLHKLLTEHQLKDLELEDLVGWNLDLRLELLLNFGEEVTTVPYIEKEYIVESAGSFLTQEAAEKHIKANSHHYTDKVHTYCIHAWRNPQIKKLIEIIEDTDWDTYI